MRCSTINPFVQGANYLVHLCHLAPAVFIDTLLGFLSETVKEIDIWSDGPSSQFKNKYIATLLPFFEQRKEITIKWNYFATSHGKGPVDGVGGILKQFVTSKIMQRKAQVHNVDYFAKVTEGCEITVVVKKKDEINKFLKLKLCLVLPRK